MNHGPGQRWYGIVTGFDRETPVFAGHESSVLALGPPRCGKTTTLVIPAILEAPGAVVSTSTKPDVAACTEAARRRRGRVWFFDPLHTLALGDENERLCWSPVPGCETFDGAVTMAHHLAAAARPAAAHTDESHWVERAEALLAPLLHAAALSCLGIAEVMRWILTRRLAEPSRILAEQAGEMANTVLAGIAETDERERSGIFSTAAGLLAVYRSEKALSAAAVVNFDAQGFVSSSDTVYICASGDAQDQTAPLVIALLEKIKAAAYRTVSGRAPLLMALDEVANIAPLRSLPAIASEGGGQGVVLLACLQDLSQARVRWGQAAEGFFSLFASKVIFPGIGDRRTLELVSALGGEVQVESVSTTTANGALLGALLGGRSVTPTRTKSIVWRPRLAVDEVHQGQPGYAFLLRRDGYVWSVKMRPWWDVDRWNREQRGLPAAPSGQQTSGRRGDGRERIAALRARLKAHPVVAVGGG